MKKKIHVLSHTHWDREWYQPFQEYRMRLVHQLDALLDILENEPEYQCFHLDGQTCCLEDYLEIRPENKERLIAQIQAGRIAIGPWYVMPDEFLVSGEALIANLKTGIALCQKFGIEPMPVGYVTDIFGHCAQFPQILQGFHIENAMLHRGTSTDEGEQTEMLWRGADGSEILLLKIYNKTGYNEFCVPGWVDYDEQEKLEEHFKGKSTLATTDILFSMQGNDHTPALKNEPARIAKMNRMLPDYDCVHSSFTDYLRELYAVLDRSKLRTVEGELRYPAKLGSFIDVFFGTGSARFDLKNKNDRCELLLARYAQPLNVWARLCGGDDNTAFLQKAWKYLLLNHPHDSIVGCSIDQVHRDMHYRFDQCRLIAKSCAAEAVRYISERIAVPKEGFSVTLFNMASIIKQVSEITLEIPMEQISDYGNGAVVTLIDSAGQEHEAVAAGSKNCNRSDYFMSKGRELDSDCYSIDWNRCPGDGAPKIALVTLDCALGLPPFSYETYTVQPQKRTESFAEREGFVENENIRLSANTNGTICLTDKASGKIYTDIGGLEDGGDCGNGWDHKYPKNDQVFLSKDGAYDVKIKCISGKLRSELEINYKWDIPAMLENDNADRSEETAAITVSQRYTLIQGKKNVLCKTTVDNTALSHRIRLLCPTDIQSGTVSFDTPFDMTDVPVQLQDTAGFVEQAREEHPMKSMVYITDGQRGFGIITKGLCEGFVKNDARRTLGITLFRTFSFPLFGYPTQDSQHQGVLEFEYTLALADTKEALWNMAEDYKLAPAAFSHLNKHLTPDNPLPPQSCLMNIGGAVLSSAHIEGNSVEIRVYNPFEKAIDNEIDLCYDYKKKAAVDFLSRPVPENSTMEAKKIVTMRFTTSI